MPREVVGQFTSGHKKGGEAVFKSAAAAKKKDAKVLRFHPSNEPYKESEDNVKAERAAQPAAAEVKAAAKAAPKKDGDS